MRCLEEAEVALFFEGRLDSFQIEKLERHIEMCPSCLALVAAVAPALASGPVDPGQTSLLRVGDVLAGRYRVEAILGAGATGYVYQARDQLVETVVALKVLRPRLADDPAWVRSFIEELQLARRIVHPNVCRVFDMQQTDGHSFLTMELASGGSLRDDIRRAAGRPAAEKLADALALTRGLAAIHAAGIAHRDVKPANVLRTEDGRILLSDFGLARASLSVAAAPRPVGTPDYMAPEVASGEPASQLSDVWSLGVTLHELYFGEKVDVRTTAVESGRKLDDPISRAMARLCADCLAAAPGDRPASAAVVLSRLEALQDQRRFNRRRRNWRVALGVFTLVAGGGAVLGQLFLSRSQPLLVAEVAPVMTIAPPEYKTEVSPDQRAAIEQALAQTPTRLAKSPLLKFRSTSPARPGPDDWTLRLEIEPSSRGPSTLLIVSNGNGERRILGSRTGLASGRPQPAEWIDLKLQQFGRRMSRQRWAERGTRSPDARAALIPLLNQGEEVSSSVALSALDLALKTDPTYLAAHIERARVLARKARAFAAGAQVHDFARTRVDALLAEESKLAQVASGEARALAARCRLLEAAVFNSGHPDDPLWSRALDLCGRAAQPPVAGLEALAALAWLQDRNCEPAAAVGSYRRALRHPSDLKYELLRQWAALALREHWPHGSALEDRLDTDVEGWTRAQRGDRPPLGLLIGGLYLQEGSLFFAHVRFRVATSLHPTYEPHATALREGLRRTEKTFRALPSERTGIYRPPESSDEQLIVRIKESTRMGARVVEQISWTAPARATQLLAALGPPPSCADAIDQSLLRRSLGVLRPEDSALSLCDPASRWVRRCKAHLQKPLGAGDPLAPKPP